MTFPLPCPAQEGVAEWLWWLSSTQAGPGHHERPCLNLLGQRRELSLDIPYPSGFVCKTSWKWRGRSSQHLHCVFLTNSLGFEVHISGSAPRGQTDHFREQHLVGAFPRVTETELGSSLLR